ncbi:hypothetical protein [Aneurinibacillus danicus]|jgi:hypothetical protein|uniref:hypothetical protein n=1 Tax=Aneurinibacillus danicus TaxID=267746 RepID=UPI0011BF773A|nr:hypothetical protein [Aneurinibacillus danicus]
MTKDELRALYERRKSMPVSHWPGHVVDRPPAQPSSTVRHQTVQQPARRGGCCFKRSQTQSAVPSQIQSNTLTIRPKSCCGRQS